MKFVDPKGALEEEDLWTDPYYDLAKLSHSVLGNYDLINNSLFVVEIGDTLAPTLALKGPDTRITPTPPTPGGVAMAQMVSVTLT